MRSYIAYNIIAGFILVAYLLAVAFGGVGEWRLPVSADDGACVVTGVLFAVLYLGLLGVCAAPDRFNFPVRTGDMSHDRVVMRAAVGLTNLCLMAVLIPLAASAMTGDAWWLWIVFIFAAWRVALFRIIGNRPGHRKRRSDEK